MENQRRIPDFSHLGHGGGFSDIKLISSPTQLNEVKFEHIGLTVYGEAMGFTDTSNHAIKKLDIYGAMLFSKINYQKNDIFIGGLNDLVFLCKINNQNLQIVFPFFNLGFSAHDQITRNYGEYTLMNITLWGNGLDREVSNLLIHENKILRLDWNKLK